MSERAAEVERVARAYFDAVGARDVEAMIGHWEPGGVGHIHGLADLRAPEGYRGWFGSLFRAFPALDAYLNGAEMARQLGALPPTGSPAERAMLGALNLRTRLSRALKRR